MYFVAGDVESHPARVRVNDGVKHYALDLMPVRPFFMGRRANSAHFVAEQHFHNTVVVFHASKLHTAGQYLHAVQVGIYMLCRYADTDTEQIPHILWDLSSNAHTTAVVLITLCC